MKKTLIWAFLLAATTATAFGQILKETETEAVKTATIAGQIAGGAFYCKIDEEDLDDFITLVYSRLGIEALDKVDKVVAHLEFSNNYSAWSARAPEQGCQLFTQEFSRKLAEFREK